MTATARQPHDEQFWMRNQTPSAPISYDPERQLWNVYGHPEALEILGNPTAFSSDISRFTPPEQQQLVAGNITNMDPPEHTKLRKLVSKAFTPKVVADLEPRIGELTAELLDGVTGRFELVDTLAYPLPVIVIAEMLGVPSSDRHLFQQWVGALLANSQTVTAGERSEEQREETQTIMTEVSHLKDYLRGHAKARRGTPRSDLLTNLVQAEVDGVGLTDDEVVNFALIMLVAGHITTTMLLGNTVLQLDDNRHARELVAADHARIPAAIEESLRMMSPFGVVARSTTRAQRIGEVEIPADQMLMVWVAAANRDARVFGEPFTFDLHRDPNPHLAFGRGVHFCLGAPLARLEGKVALSILLERFPNLRVDPEKQPVFLPNPNLTGVHSLPLLT